MKFTGQSFYMEGSINAHYYLLKEMKPLKKVNVQRKPNTL